jgi:type IV secretory pathway VirB4 component
MDEGFTSTLPLCIDELGIVRSTTTSSLAGSFPFISNDLTSDSGILYGLNMHTGGLVVFDRFNSNLPNMNSVILATSGAGKSFTVKLEILRYLLNDIHVLVIDPENEYKGLIEKVGGTYINIATSSGQFINPFDIPPKIEDIEYGPGDLLRGQIMNLIGLISTLIGGLTPTEEAVLDKAIQNTYSLKGMTLETNDYTGKTPPIMQDLLNVLDGMQGAENMMIRLSKYVTGTFGKVFNNYTNVDLDNQLTVFSIRDLEEALKTPAMYNVLNFIRTKVRSKKMKRMLVCDEAWIMLQNEISANFLFGLIKRARKYGMGITTISQDIEDFVKSKYGKPIISNSALQILLKQSTTSIKSLNSLLGLSEAEQQRLVAAGIGEGLIFAGQQHIAVKILASEYEKSFISTDVA